MEVKLAMPSRHWKLGQPHRGRRQAPFLGLRAPPALGDGLRPPLLTGNRRPSRQSGLSLLFPSYGSLSSHASRSVVHQTRRGSGGRAPSVGKRGWQKLVRKRKKRVVGALASISDARSPAGVAAPFALAPAVARAARRPPGAETRCRPATVRVERRGSGRPVPRRRLAGAGR